ASAYQLNKAMFSFTHIEYILNIKYETIAFSRKFGRNILGITGGFLYTYDIPHTVIDQNEPSNFKTIGKFGFADKLFGLTYSIKVADSVIGVTLKYLNETIESVDARGFAFDLGLLKLSDKYNIGVSIQNIAERIKYMNQYEEIPYILRAGILYKMKNLNIHYELTKPSDAEFENKLAIDFSFLRFAQLQAGIRHMPSKLLVSDLYSLTGGFSIKFMNYRIDYAIAGFKDLGITHRVSLVGSF
ncbi:MAG: hypothetical protein NZ870_03725, partial [bacterium]|nr:hypothetical protein [bacterium]